MATTIKSTGLDFNNIRANLKTAFAQNPEFADYNFEASGLSAILDVLAYNTHYNALTANYALNESFLTTAQLRSSVVGLASSIGYIPGSRKSSSCLLQLSVTDIAGPTSKTLPANTKFTSSVDGTSYTFQTLESYTGIKDGSGVYQFKTSAGSTSIPVFEGVEKTKTFIAGVAPETEIYVIPDETLNLDTVVITVFEDGASSSFTTYTNVNEATSISSSSTIYVLKEAPNGYFELSFGNGSNLGQTPAVGEKIVVSYLSTKGAEANGARSFAPQASLGGLNIDITTVSSQSNGGLRKEGIESIRRNAPFLYAAQNRMVTAEDYGSLAQRNYSGFIENIKAWGGEDNIPPKYGAVYLSIDYFSSTDESTKNEVEAGITSLARDLSVASFDVEYVKPTVTYLQTEVAYQFNPKLTGETQSAIKSKVDNTITSYFNANLGTFDKTFRRSNMLSNIDDVDPSVLSSRATIKMQQRRSTSSIDYDQPINLGSATNYNFYFPAPISSPLNDEYVVESSNFTYNGSVSFIRNQLETNNLQIISLSTGKVVVDNIGSYDAGTGEVKLVGFNISAYNGNYLRVTVLPANQSAITPIRSNILEHDPTVSITTAVSTSSL
jgi:hypothetical protein